MKILSFLGHTRYYRDLAKTGHTFYIWHSEQSIGIWDDSFGKQPDNIIFIDNDRNIDYDLAIINQYHEFDMIKDFEIPIIALAHGYVPNVYSKTVAAIVGQSKRNLAKSTHNNKHLIRHGFDPEEFYGYTGDINIVVTAAGDVSNRPELRKEIIDAVINMGIPHTYIGYNNGMLHNGSQNRSIDIMYGIYRHYRGMIYTANIACGMSYAVGEAMMTGMPVALGDFADWKDIITNNVNGFVSDNPSELYVFLKTITDSKDYAKEIGQCAREMMIDMFHIDTFINNWNDVINQVMER